MASFSLSEKLTVTGAFLVLVAMLVGTEDDPGVVVTGQAAIADARQTTPARAPSPQYEVVTTPSPGFSSPPSTAPNFVLPAPTPTEAAEPRPIGRPVLGGLPANPINSQRVD